MTTEWGDGKALPPEVTDPVVVGGVKYRIRSFAGELTIARTSFGNTWVRLPTASLSWDKRAGVWRTSESWVQVHHHPIPPL